MAAVAGPLAHADQARQALRQLAHETRHLQDPTVTYPLLSDLANGLASLAQSLRQIAVFHEGPHQARAVVAGDVRAGQAASYRVAWELRRAAEMLLQVASGLDRAHEVEATIAYDLDDIPTPAAPPLRPHEPGLSL